MLFSKTEWHQVSSEFKYDCPDDAIIETFGSVERFKELLSQQEQSAYDRAVKMGNGVAARHYAIINASRVRRLLDKGIEGLKEGEIEKLGLNKPVTTTTPANVLPDEEPPSGSQQAQDNQAAASTALQNLQDNTASYLESAAAGGEENVAATQQNIKDLETALSASSQNPSGQISLKDGGLASKPKKKKNKK